MLEREDGRYANTPATELFLDRAKPSYVGGMLEMANARLYPFWGVADRGPADRGAAERGQGAAENFFEALYADPDRLAQFAARDERDQRRRGPAIAEKFPWEDHST